MSKYQPLTHYLEERRATELPMTFAEIERVLGTALPASKRHPAWWSNNPANNVMTRAWLKAGYVTERVDITGERLVFRRKPGARSEADRAPQAEAAPAGGLYDRLRTRLAGTVTIAPGFDITEPTGEVWDAEL